MTRVIAEIGSCHLGIKEVAIKLIDAAQDAGCWAVKFQLFPNTDQYTKSGNIWLDPGLYLELQDYAKKREILCGASTFDEENLQFLVEEAKPDFYKFAYSKKDERALINYALCTARPVFVSCDVMTQHLVPKGAATLYCIPEYPVRYEVCFDELFPRFDGFSDHTLGIQQSLKAIDSGAEYLEKHMKLEGQMSCPDALFAIDQFEMKSLVKSIGQTLYVPNHGENIH